ncbi:MAG: hypothetical protein SPJ07_00955 [Bacilli bacterium]|nr:hypothetical protein [Bacilli bacterium]
MKNNECFVKLIPMDNINFLDLRKIAKNYYENGDLLTSSKSFSYLSFSIYDAINVCAIEKDDRLYEKMTNREISLNGIDSIKDGFIAIKSSSLEVSNDDKGIITFFDMCKNRRNKIECQVKEYTFDVMSNDSLIIKYMNDILDKDKAISFRRVYIYNNDLEEVKSYIMPLKRIDNIDKTIYTDITFGYEFDKDNEYIFVSDMNIIPDISDFDILSGVYDFINDRDCVCREFDDVLGTKNNKVRIYNK